MTEAVVTHAAQVVSLRLERIHRLAKGSLLGVAWIGASRAAARWSPAGGASLATLCRRHAWSACVDALRDGQAGDPVLSRRSRGRAGEPRPGDWSRRTRAGVLGVVLFQAPELLAAPSAPLVALEAAEVLERVAARRSPRHARVLWEVVAMGRTARAVARELGVSPAWAGWLLARAREAAA